MNKKIHRILMLYGLYTMYGNSMMFFLVFLFAWFSPSKSTTVFINAIGEANIELVMLLITVPLNICALFYLSPKVIKELNS